MDRTVVEDSGGRTRFSRLERDDGQTMVEYGFVLVTIALVAITAYQLFGGRVSDLVNTVTT
jgi:Flp pilus assembly pilin Flp